VQGQRSRVRLSELRATTTLAAVIGSPVRHSLSPVVHNAAFERLGLDWACVALEVGAGHGEEAVAGARTLGLGGLSVTMPHKAAARRAADRCTATAERLDAVNCMSWDGDAWVGDNTDGAGFLDSLRVDHGVDPDGQRCMVLGAGGAARAVVLALADAGAADISVVNRTTDRAQAAAALAGRRGRVGTLDDADSAGLVVNATPVGMAGQTGTVSGREGGDLCAVPRERLRPGQVVVDLVYDPVETALLTAARERGATTVNGLGMLVHQAAHSFARWTGTRAPVSTMLAAVTAELVRRNQSPDAGEGDRS